MAKVVNRTGGGGGLKINGMYSDTQYRVEAEPVVKGDFVTTGIQYDTPPLIKVPEQIWPRHPSSKGNRHKVFQLTNSKYLLVYTSQNKINACILTYNADYTALTKGTTVIVYAGNFWGRSVQTISLGNNRYAITFFEGSGSAFRPIYGSIFTLQPDDSIVVEVSKGVVYSSAYTTREQHATLVGDNKLLLLFSSGSSSFASIVVTYDPQAKTFVGGATTVLASSSAATINVTHLIDGTTKVICVWSLSQVQYIMGVLSISEDVITVGSGASISTSYMNGVDDSVIFPVSDEVFIMGAPSNPASSTREFRAQLLRVTGMNLSLVRSKTIQSGTPYCARGYRVSETEYMFYCSFGTGGKFDYKFKVVLGADNDLTLTSVSVPRPQFVNNYYMAGSPFDVFAVPDAVNTTEYTELIVSMPTYDGDNNIYALTSRVVRAVNKARGAATGVSLGNGLVGERVKVVDCLPA